MQPSVGMPGSRAMKDFDECSSVPWTRLPGVSSRRDASVYVSVALGCYTFVGRPVRSQVVNRFLAPTVYAG